MTQMPMVHQHCTDVKHVLACDEHEKGLLPESDQKEIYLRISELLPLIDTAGTSSSKKLKMVQWGEQSIRVYESSGSPLK